MPKSKPAKKASPEEFSKRFQEMKYKLKSLDRTDYRRTIAGRGDTHALDGGKTLPQSPGRKLAATLPVWQDRDVKKRGSKLSK